MSIHLIIKQKPKPKHKKIYETEIKFNIQDHIIKINKFNDVYETTELVEFCYRVKNGVYDIINDDTPTDYKDFLKMLGYQYLISDFVEFFEEVKVYYYNEHGIKHDVQIKEFKD